MDNHVVRQLHLWSHLAFRIVRHHDLNLDADGSLSHLHVSNSLRDVVPLRLSSGDQIALSKLHCLGTLRTQLAADDDLHTLGTVLHDESENTVAGTADGQATNEFEAKRLALSHGAASAVLHSLCEQFHAVLGKAKTFLHQCCEFTNSASLLSQDLTSPGGPNDDLSADRSDTHFHTRISVFTQCACQELIQLGVENTICHKLSLLGDL
mmetsp:Transcript_21150/g.44160  ORF Transcript_21150/g.44160 Transcript_21150/m.44160 type:complete len:209 (+) Transcript_21150:210-836(+)